MTTFYIVLWIAVGFVSITSIAIARSQWGKKRPLHRCVMLSLAAHLVLIGVAAMVRFVSWPPGEGTGEPLRITIVASAPSQAVVDEPVDAPQVVNPPLETPEEVLPTPDEIETTEPVQTPVKPIVTPPQAPELLNEPAEELTPKPRTVSPAAEAAETAPLETDVAAPPSEAPTAATPPVPAPAVPASLAERTQPDRLQKVIEQGGSRNTEQAVGRALEWLAYAQSEGGSWDSNRWQGGREFAVLGHNRGGAGSQADTGISALALLTFLGAGHSHFDGPYREHVTDGLNYLIRSQAGDGNLYGESTLYARTYCHSMATFALAEALALTGDERLKPSVRSAVDFLVRTQNQKSGGWRYRPGNQGDVSQLGWIIMALRSSELAGVEVPDATWQRIEHFLSLVVRGERGGLAAYQPRAQVSRAMTAEALYCRQVLGKPLKGGALNEALAALEAELPGNGQANYYYWYYATLALHHSQNESSAARHTWNRWNERLKRSLVESQVTDGSNGGSWSPHTVWGGYGGRVYSTAMATMCLEVYYRFGSGQGDESPWVASRPRGKPVRQ
ncbi:MAG: hypothetical protein ACR2NU_07220 [Aeoliella sp.]